MNLLRHEKNTKVMKTTKNTKNRSQQQTVYPPPTQKNQTERIGSDRIGTYSEIVREWEGDPTREWESARERGSLLEQGAALPYTALLDSGASDREHPRSRSAPQPILPDSVPITICTLDRPKLLVLVVVVLASRLLSYRFPKRPLCWKDLFLVIPSMSIDVFWYEALPHSKDKREGGGGGGGGHGRPSAVPLLGRESPVYNPSTNAAIL